MISVEICSGNSFDKIVQTPGLQLHLASFLEDKELFHFSATCKSFSKILLSDKFWKERLIATNDTALLSIALTPRQSELFSQYANHFNFERGAKRAVELTTRFTNISFRRTIRLPGESDLSYTKRWYQGFHNKPTPVIFLCSASLIGISLFIYKFPMNDLLVRVVQWIVLPQTAPLGVISTALLLHRLKVPQRIGGNMEVLKPRVFKICKKMGCQTASRRVTTCWQALGRGVQKIRVLFFNRPSK